MLSTYHGHISKNCYRRSDDNKGDTVGWFRRHKNGIKVLSISPPAAAPDRSGIAIALCVRNEEAYIAEWARFHQAVGTRHFIVYDNGSTDGTVRAIVEAVGKDQVTIIPWAGQIQSTKTAQLIDGQVYAFAHAILNFGAQFKRMAFIDADEFLLPRSGSTLEEALSATNGFPNVSLPWHMFGTSGHASRPEGPVTKNFVKRSADPMSTQAHVLNFKCIVDPCEVTEVSIHQFKTRTYGDLTSNDGGFQTTRDGRKNPKFYSNTHLQLNHYYSKSREEMAAKIARGSNYAVSPAELLEKMTSTLHSIEQAEVEDRSMVEFLKSRSIVLE
jgi:hypothetical protein